ncbi:hypothetical protein J3D54_002388 [Pseudomonas sp. GGS8]|uniref:hypothetical protein n=1 Tax=Pseudomonas sp. GGS8 TaxID=2817892 RepID=UPI0020A14A52|nr:hypothetical protein [Pseudomonas sp. GGS8]MCP1443256.1 hypothetical protein [Pseudomonas sp. GGS8]
MRPKPPHRLKPDGVNLSPDSLEPPRLPGDETLTRQHSNIVNPHDFHPQGRQPLLPDVRHISGATSVEDVSASESGVEISDTPGLGSGKLAAQYGLETYLLPPALLSGMQPPDGQGLRWMKGRKFVDIENEGTAYVEFDIGTGTYRATDLYRKLPSGPALYKNEGALTWRQKETITEGSPDQSAVHQRPVVEAQPGHSRSRSDSLEQELLASQPSAKKTETGLTAHSNTPDTVDSIDAGRLLIDGPLKWLYPSKTGSERYELLESYNLSSGQLTRLHRDMNETHTFPAWAESHKRLSLQADSSQRFDLIAAEVALVIPQLRRQSQDDYSPHDLYCSSEFLDHFSASIGYQRNKHGLLYRTDIPAMFRGDDRTPFELARDRRMIAREGLPETVTQRAQSATFLLSDAKEYASNLGGHAKNDKLRYNAQANLFPGVRKSPKGKFEDDSDEDYRNESSNSDSDSSFTLDKSRDYEPIRYRQHVGFIYMIDTRGIEVVPGRENLYLNDDGSSSFHPDALEGVISISKRGLNSDRVWLVNSDLTRAAPVNEVYEQAGNNADAIEHETWIGTFNRDRYDQLVDQVVDKGWGITFPENQAISSDDIVWPTVEPRS